MGMFNIADDAGYRQRRLIQKNQQMQQKALLRQQQIETRRRLALERALTKGNAIG
jgi:hypothetical protein